MVTLCADRSGGMPPARFKPHAVPLLDDVTGRDQQEECRTGAWREGLAAAAAFIALTVFYTSPWAFRPQSLSYGIEGADGQFAVWNVAWVARALVLDPRHVFDANIFYPERGTLAYSEANLGSGALAAPVYWATGSPFAAHAFVVLLSFVLSGLATYALIRYLGGRPLGALIGGIAFAFAPHLFSHLSHIQLLWTAGLPAGLLAYHRLVDRPTARAGALLGATVSAQMYLCAYYGVFLVLVLGAFTLWTASYRRMWYSGRFWQALSVGALAALALTLPLLLAVVRFQRTTGFTRSLSASEFFSANWSAYVASAASAHSWILPYLPPWHDVLFPGFVASIFAVVGAVRGTKDRDGLREVAWVYLGLSALATWASFGPSAGLYRWLYATIPPLWLMRAPSRFGVAVLLACAVLCGIGVSTVSSRSRWSRVAGGLLLGAAILEHIVPLSFSTAKAPEAVYRALAALPPGPVLETPVYSRGVAFLRAKYMLASTHHWMPLVNAYSDYMPPSLDSRLDVLGGFPSPDSLRELTRDRVRYAVVHLDALNEQQRAALEERLHAFAAYLALRHEDTGARLYEITGSPPH